MAYPIKLCKDLNIVVTDSKGRYVPNSFKNVTVAPGPIDHFTYNLDNLTDGSYMFYNNLNLLSFKSKCPKIDNGLFMFGYCKNLKTVDIEVPEATKLEYTFFECQNLEDYKILYSPQKLKHVFSMFLSAFKIKEINMDLPECPSLGRFASGRGWVGYQVDNKDTQMALSKVTLNVPKVKEAYEAFWNCLNITEFNVNFPSCTIMNHLFHMDKPNFSKLTTVTSEFPVVENADVAFNNCSALTTITSTFPKLKTGIDMFTNCLALSKETIENILRSLPTWTDGKTYNISFKNIPAMSTVDATIGTSKGWTVQS